MHKVSESLPLVKGVSERSEGEGFDFVFTGGIPRHSFGMPPPLLKGDNFFITNYEKA